MNKLFITILFIIFFYPLSAQKWVEMMQDGAVNFYDTQKEFNEYYKDRTYEKGKGWKQFKRWEYFMEQRVYPSGRLPKPTQAWSEHIEYMKDHSSELKVKTGGNWMPLGPSDWFSTGWNPGLGRVNCVMVDHGNSNIIYFGAPSGGCWKSTDGGNSWFTTTDGLPIIGVSGIAIDPVNHDIVYLGTGDGDGGDTYSIGVLKSTDGGNSWNTTGLNWQTTQTKRINKILIHPTDPNILFAATNNGIFYSSDAANNWILVQGGNFSDIEFKPGNTGIVYASSDEFFRSSDNGLSFTKITYGLPPDTDINRAFISVSEAAPDHVYFLCGSSDDASFYGLYRSENTGVTFSLRTNSPNLFCYAEDGSGSGGQSWYDMALAVSPTNPDEVYVGGINVWKSIDGGLSFNINTHWYYPTTYGYVHADIHSLDFFGSNLYCGSDGGIFKTSNNGNTWTDLSKGIEITQFYRIGGSPTNPNLIIGGTQDNGTNLLRLGVWTHVLGADGMEAIIDYSNPDIMYGAIQNGDIYKSTDGGLNFNYIAGNITEGGAWVTPYVIDPFNSSTLYAGYKNVWKTTDGGSNWATISNFNPSYSLRSLAVAPSNPGYLYAATYDTLYKTTDGGASWTFINDGLPSNAITYIAVNPTDPENIWVTLSGFSNGEKVYRTDDAGASWTNISGNLPNLPVNCIVYKEGSDDGIYVGTDVGIYYKDNTLTNWQPFMNNLPNVIVNELEIHYGSGKIRAATYGRGIWESDLYTPVAAPPEAQFVSDNTTICPGDSIQFTDQSLNATPGWIWLFYGGTPTFSTMQNPVVTYYDTGIFYVKLIVYNSYGTDTLIKSNYIEVTYPETSASPITEGFESPGFAPQGWKIDNHDNYNTWEGTTSAGGFGVSFASATIDNFNPNTIGERDALITPAIDLSLSSFAALSFDVAYVPYSTTYSDTLAIFYSTDCGITKNLLYLKGGEDLATGSSSTSPFIPADSEWRKDSIDLSGLPGISSVQIFFENHSGWGNFLYLDNININIDVPPGIKNEIKNNILINVFPNPASDLISVNFTSNNNKPVKVFVYDIDGKLVKTFLQEKVKDGYNIFSFSTTTLSAGTYILRIFSSEGKFLVEKIMKL
ncbi:MAG: T9SS type A sorting domain-containing protein [Bacteroidota bacterium]